MKNKYEVMISGDNYNNIRDDIESVAKRASINIEFDGSSVAIAQCDSKEEALNLAKRINNNIIAINNKFRLLVAHTLECRLDNTGEVEDTISI